MEAGTIVTRVHGSIIVLTAARKPLCAKYIAIYLTFMMATSLLPALEFKQHSLFLFVIITYMYISLNDFRLPYFFSNSRYS